MIPRQAYAPTPHSYVPNSSLSATINLDEVRFLRTPPLNRTVQETDTSAARKSSSPIAVPSAISRIP